MDRLAASRGQRNDEFGYIAQNVEWVNVHTLIEGTAKDPALLLGLRVRESTTFLFSSGPVLPGRRKIT
jgi:hypothetical protein